MRTDFLSFLKNDIFYDKKEYADIVIDVYEQFPKERHYIDFVMEDYVHGASRYETFKRLKYNIIDVYKHCEKKASYLDEAYKNAMKGDK